MDSKNL